MSPFWKRSGSPMISTNTNAVIAPMPGCVINRCTSGRHWPRVADGEDSRRAGINTARSVLAPCQPPAKAASAGGNAGLASRSTNEFFALQTSANQNIARVNAPRGPAGASLFFAFELSESLQEFHQIVLFDKILKARRPSCIRNHCSSVRAKHQEMCCGHEPPNEST